MIVFGFLSLTIDGHLVVCTLVAFWFLAALAGSLLGAFDSDYDPPIALGMAAVLPVVAFAIAYLRSSELRQLVMSLDLRLLTAAQTWRVGGFVFLLLYWQGTLPAAFALPAGWGDIVIGATAPLVAWAISRPRGLSKSVFVTWNVLGTLDLVMAVALGILSSAGPLGILAGEATTRPMGQFPLSMIPTFFVPLLVIFHLVCMARARQEHGVIVSQAA